MLNKKLFKFILTAILFTVGAAFTSCNDSFIFDDEGDCSPKVKFVFTKNRQALQTIDGEGPDAFTQTVKSVHLFVFDSTNGELVFEKTENTENLIGRNTMSVDLTPGTYTFVAWCGLDSNDENNAFELKHNYKYTRADGDEHCRLKMATDNDPVHDAKYDALYHGVVKDVTFTIETMEQTVEIPVVKDTNDITVWIQHPEANFKNGDYTVVYEDANGTLDFHSNELTSEDNKLTYRHHSSSVLSADAEYNGDSMQAGAMISHLSVSRLMAHHVKDARLKVLDRQGNEVFSIPFISYLLEMQTFTDGQKKDNQWYLDCEDTYTCSFYLVGDQGTWSAYRIIINNWVKVPDQKEEF